MKNVLLVEDDEGIASMVILALESAGYSPTLAFNLAGANKYLENNNYLIIILDIGLPDGEGIEIFNRGSEIPVIVLSARKNIEDKIKALNLGADDYLTKPFEPAELITRIETVLRRSEKESKEYTLNNLIINFDTRVVTKNNNIIDLTPKEMELLIYFIKNINKPLKREEILDTIWGHESESSDRTVDIHVGRLRKKLNINSIATIFKYGYIFKSV